MRMLAQDAPRHGAAVSPPLALELHGIYKSFGAIQANSDISLALRRGEILGLLGENGAGKSTLMKIVYGLYRPDAGTITVDGRPTAMRSPRDAVRHGIGMVHQHFTLVPPLTVAENIVLGAEPRRGLLLNRQASIAATERLCQRYGLEVDPTARVADLSIGVQQRVEILKALYRDARILILDEPTAVLTPQEAQNLFGVLQELAAQQLSVILITHKLGELLGVSHRITVVRDGRVVGTMPTAEADEAMLARLMVGRDVLLRVEKPHVTAGDVRLEAHGLVVSSRSGRVAVDGVDLRVRAGEIVGIAGVDGNGQIELVEALAGTRALTRGKIVMNGNDVTRLDADTRRKRGLAYVPEDRHHKGLVLDFSLAENFVLKTIGERRYTRWGWIRARAIRRRAMANLALFDVRPPDPALPARVLSGGNQQKAIVGRELADDPDVLIVVQPTRGVDVGAIEAIHRQLLDQRARGKAILLISLELDELRALADRIVVMHAGAIVGEVSPDVSAAQLGLLMAGERLQEAAL